MSVSFIDALMFNVLALICLAGIFISTGRIYLIGLANSNSMTYAKVLELAKTSSIKELTKSTEAKCSSWCFWVAIGSIGIVVAVLPYAVLNLSWMQGVLVLLASLFVTNLWSAAITVPEYVEDKNASFTLWVAGVSLILLSLGSATMAGKTL